MFDGKDASDAFHSLHSEKAIAQLKRMRPVEAKQPVPAPHKVRRGGGWGGAAHSSLRRFRSTSSSGR